MGQAFRFKIGAAVLAGFLMIATQACTDEETLSAIGLGGIVGGAAAIQSAEPRVQGHCVGGYRDQCHAYANFWGERITECRAVYDRCARVIQPFDMLDLAQGVEMSVQPQGGERHNDDGANPTKWAIVFGIPFERAQRLVSALAEAQEGHVKNLKELGVEGEALRALAKQEIPSEDALKPLARNLDQDIKATQEMIARILENAKKERKRACRMALLPARACG